MVEKTSAGPSPTFVCCIAVILFNLPQYVLPANDVAYIPSASKRFLSLPTIRVAEIPTGATIGRNIKIDDAECRVA